MKIQRRIAPDFIDPRGTITKLLDDGSTTIRSVLLISSAAGAVRAMHYHKKDSHYAYMVSGRMEFTEWPVNDLGRREITIVEAGDIVFSAPMTVHVMRFLEDSVFLALATESRHQDAYEADTVRVTEPPADQSSSRSS